MAHDWDVHPDMQNLLNAKQSINPDVDESSSVMEGWAEYDQSLDRPYPENMQVWDSEIPRVIDDSMSVIPIRIYRPNGLDKKAACVMYFHGGGFVKGDLNSSDTIAWGIADQTRAVVISVAYRLAPENPYPAATEDCFYALEYCVSCATEFGIDTDRIGVWGDSAGGNLAATVCLLSRDRGGPRIRAQALNYPCLTDDLSANSYRDNADAPGLSTQQMREYWNQYLGGRRPAEDGYAAPLKAKRFNGLAPAHVHIAEFDPLADDGRSYADLLKKAGVETEFRVAPKMIHGYLRARFDGDAAAAEFDAPCKFLRNHLKRH